MEPLCNANELAGDSVVTPVEVPEDLPAVTLSIENLPEDWGAVRPAPETADIGTQWARRRDTAVLIVPSAVIPRETNYLLNPLHPEFSKVRFLDPEPFRFDVRLERAWRKR